MREALDILGLGPCHHMFAVSGSEKQKSMWRSLVQGSYHEWDTLFSGFSCCVDWPSAYYWEELSTFYPDAKIILTRRSAESWWASFEKTILPSIQNSTDSDSLGLSLIHNKVFSGNPGNKEHAITVYEENIKKVIATTAPERLHIHNLGDGWESLCAFLKMPVPKQPYPSRNNTKQFHAANQRSTNGK